MAVPLPSGGEAKWGINPALGVLPGVPNGDVPPFYQGG
jgi:hypothetical protein